MESAKAPRFCGQFARGAVVDHHQSRPDRTSHKSPASHVLLVLSSATADWRVELSIAESVGTSVA